MRRIMVALSVLLVCMATSAIAHAAPALSGETVIESAQSGYVRVRLDQTPPIDFRAQDNSQFRIEGSGRVIGFVLRSDRPPDKGDFVLAVLRSNPDVVCPTGGCAANDGLSVVAAHNGLTPLGMPAGDYRLYLLADSAPVRITLTMAKAGGTVRLEPTVVVASQSATLPARTPHARPEFAAFGRDILFAQPGMALVSMGWRAAAHAYDRTALCLYAGGTPTTQPGASLAYGPDCAGASHTSITSDNRVATSTSAWQRTALFTTLPGGLFGVGGSVTQAGAASGSPTATAAWIAYEGTEHDVTAPQQDSETPRRAHQPTADPPGPAPPTEVSPRQPCRPSVRATRDGRVVNVVAMSAVPCRVQLALRAGRAALARSAATIRANRATKTRLRFRGPAGRRLVLHVTGPNGKWLVPVRERSTRRVGVRR